MFKVPWVLIPGLISVAVAKEFPGRLSLDAQSGGRGRLRMSRLGANWSVLGEVVVGVKGEDHFRPITTPTKIQTIQAITAQNKFLILPSSALATTAIYKCKRNLNLCQDHASSALYTEQLRVVKRSGVLLQTERVQGYFIAFLQYILPLFCRKPEFRTVFGDEIGLQTGPRQSQKRLSCQLGLRLARLVLILGKIG